MQAAHAPPGTMNAIIDRSAPGVGITVLPDERSPSVEPLNLDGS